MAELLASVGTVIVLGIAVCTLALCALLPVLELLALSGLITAPKMKEGN